MPAIACLLIEPTERALEACAHLTPVVEPLDDRILMDWTGCGPVAGLAQTLREELSRNGEDGPSVRLAVPKYRLGVAPLRFVAEALVTGPTGETGVPSNLPPLSRPKRTPGARRARTKGSSNDALYIPIAGGFYVTEQTLPAFIREWPLPRLPGLDPRTEQTLFALALRTLGDVAAVPVPLLREHIGSGTDRLLDWARGRDTRSVAPLYPPERIRQRISTEALAAVALSNGLTSSSDRGLACPLKEALTPLTERLRATGQAVSQGAVYGGPGAKSRRMRTFTEPLADPDHIVRALQSLAEDVLTDLAGRESVDAFSFSDDLIIEIVPTRESRKQMTLWDGHRPRNARQDRLQTVLDSLRHRFGDAIGFTKPREAVVRYETMLHLYGAKG